MQLVIFQAVSRPTVLLLDPCMCMKDISQNLSCVVIMIMALAMMPDRIASNGTLCFGSSTVK